MTRLRSIEPPLRELTMAWIRPCARAFDEAFTLKETDRVWSIPRAPILLPLAGSRNSGEQ
jgi:hypothetical protein